MLVKEHVHASAVHMSISIPITSEALQDSSLGKVELFAFCCSQIGFRLSACLFYICRPSVLAHMLAHPFIYVSLVDKISEQHLHRTNQIWHRRSLAYTD